MLWELQLLQRVCLFSHLPFRALEEAQHKLAVAKKESSDVAVPSSEEARYLQYELKRGRRILPPTSHHLLMHHLFGVNYLSGARVMNLVEWVVQFCVVHWCVCVCVWWLGMYLSNSTRSDLMVKIAELEQEIERFVFSMSVSAIVHLCVWGVWGCVCVCVCVTTNLTECVTLCVCVCVKTASWEQAVERGICHTGREVQALQGKCFFTRQW